MPTPKPIRATADQAARPNSRAAAASPAGPDMTEPYRQRPEPSCGADWPEGHREDKPSERRRVACIWPGAFSPVRLDMDEEKVGGQAGPVLHNLYTALVMAASRGRGFWGGRRGPIIRRSSHAACRAGRTHRFSPS